MVVKSKVMSLSVEPEMQETLKISAKKMGLSVSELVRKLVSRHLDLIVNDGEEIPVVIRVPINLVENEEALYQWLNIKSHALVKALKPKLWK